MSWVESPLQSRGSHASALRDLTVKGRPSELVVVKVKGDKQVMKHNVAQNRLRS